MNKFSQFFTQMDSKALRAVAVLLAMFAVVIGIILFARHSVGLSQSELADMFTALKDTPWALPVTILVFIAAAFVGAPQWVLIAVTVLAFGPQTGGIYAWIATMVSASFDFWLARIIGAQRIEALSVSFLKRIITLVRRNGLLTSFAVRLVPTGPFVLVNMAAGVSGLGFGSFIAGTGLGIVPKILVVVLLGQGVLTTAQGERFMFAGAIAALVVVVIMLLARRVLQPLVKTDDDTDLEGG